MESFLKDVHLIVAAAKAYWGGLGEDSNGDVVTNNNRATTTTTTMRRREQQQQQQQRRREHGNVHDSSSSSIGSVWLAVGSSGGGGGDDDDGKAVHVEGRRLWPRAALEDTMHELVGQLDPGLVQRCACIARHRASGRVRWRWKVAAVDAR